MTVKTRRRHWSWGSGAWILSAAPWLLMVLVVLELANGLGAAWLRWEVTTTWNPAFLEGLSWWHGQLSLPYRLWDTAYLAEIDKVYNVFPPLQSIIGFLATAPLQWTPEAPQLVEMRVLPLLLFGVPLPIVGYVVFYRRVGGKIADYSEPGRPRPRLRIANPSPTPGRGGAPSGKRQNAKTPKCQPSIVNRQLLWAAVLTLGWLGGTAVLPCIQEARHGGVHHINHLLSQVGLLLLAGELVGRRRIGVALIGLLIACWSRQMTGLYGVALLVVAWQTETSKRRESTGETPVPQSGRNLGLLTVMPGYVRRMVVAVIGLAVIAAVPMGLNWAKFGSPLESGYELIYVDRDHELARDARAHGLWSPKFIARNAYYMNAAIPWGFTEDGGLGWRPSEHGTSIWLTTPLLAFVLLGAGAWWREVPARTLMLCSVPLICILLLYHGTGRLQYGYWRFALDFIPVWLVVGGCWLTTGWRRYATLGCVAWSVTYFAMLGRWDEVMRV